MSNKNEPAFPASHLDTAGKGLTKREWLAGLLLQGLIANSGCAYSSPDYYANESVAFADALLKKLEKTGGAG